MHSKELQRHTDLESYVLTSCLAGARYMTAMSLFLNLHNRYIDGRITELLGIFMAMYGKQKTECPVHKMH